MRSVVLISCCARKLSEEAPAADLYISPLFRKSLKYAKGLTPDAIYILSAKYRLLELDRIISPYDATLCRMSKPEIRSWATEVLNQIRQKADLNADRFVILAGVCYREFIVPHLSNVEIPMKDMRIGEQLSFLNRNTNG